jgi:hypothetical protein
MEETARVVLVIFIASHKLFGLQVLVLVVVMLKVQQKPMLFVIINLLETILVMQFILKEKLKQIVL